VSCADLFVGSTRWLKFWTCCLTKFTQSNQLYQNNRHLAHIPCHACCEYCARCACLAYCVCCTWYTCCVSCVFCAEYAYSAYGVCNVCGGCGGCGEWGASKWVSWVSLVLCVLCAVGISYRTGAAGRAIKLEELCDVSEPWAVRWIEEKQCESATVHCVFVHCDACHAIRSWLLLPMWANCLSGLMDIIVVDNKVGFSLELPATGAFHWTTILQRSSTSLGPALTSYNDGDRSRIWIRTKVMHFRTDSILHTHLGDNKYMVFHCYNGTITIFSTPSIDLHKPEIHIISVHPRHKLLYLDILALFQWIGDETKTPEALRRLHTLELFKPVEINIKAYYDYLPGSPKHYLPQKTRLLVTDWIFIIKYTIDEFL